MIASNIGFLDKPLLLFNFTYHGFFFLLFIKRMYYAFSKSIYDPMKAESEAYIQTFKGGDAAILSPHLLKCAIHAMFGITSVQNDRFAKFFVNVEIGESILHFYAILASIMLVLMPNDSYWLRHLFIAKFWCYIVYGIPYIVIFKKMWLQLPQYIYSDSRIGNNIQLVIDMTGALMVNYLVSLFCLLYSGVFTMMIAYNTFGSFSEALPYVMIFVSMVVISNSEHAIESITDFVSKYFFSRNPKQGKVL